MPNPDDKTSFDFQTATKILDQLAEDRKSAGPPTKGMQGAQPAAPEPFVLVKITANNDDGTYDANEVRRKSDGTFESFSNNRVFDNGSSSFGRLKEFDLNDAAEVDKIYLAYVKRTSDKTFTWYFKASSVASARPYVKIISSSTSTTYSGDLLNNPVDETILESTITIKALQCASGAVTNNTKWFADLQDDVYYIQPPVAL